MDSAGTLTDVDQLISDNAEQYQIFYVVDPPDSPTIIANLSYLDADVKRVAHWIKCIGYHIRSWRQNFYHHSEKN